MDLSEAVFTKLANSFKDVQFVLVYILDSVDIERSLLHCAMCQSSVR